MPQHLHLTSKQALLAAALLCLLSLVKITAKNPAAQAATPQRLTNPDEACTQCHATIVTSYQQTSMARGSGLATDALSSGSFTHAPSEVTYRISERDGIARLQSKRENVDQPLDDTEQLTYFIGSGKHGRTYLFSRSNGDAKLWFEAPVNWYTKRSSYGMAPAYDKAVSAPLALPTDANCLHCHATAIQQPLATAPNAFRNQPFLQAGIGCSSCHGDAAEHVRTQGKAHLLKLSDLAPAKRDSICLQCHLEGDAMVQRAGRSLSRFVPGEDLSETAVYFVNASSPKSVQRASSQYEGLLRSACRRAVGDALTCTTCHDPHSSPSPEQRIAFYRGKCLQCHSDSATFSAAAHHPEQQDCASCHMPSRPTSDISHEQNVDHDIEARPYSALAAKSALQLRSLDEPAPARFTHAVDLVAVGATQPTARELGLAYAQFALHGDRDSYARAVDFLRKTEQSGNADTIVHEQLGYLAQVVNNASTARTEYEAALLQNPRSNTALANLAVLEAQGGDGASAIRHLSSVSDANPAETAALLNLALLQCRSNKPADARQTLRRALFYNPDNPEARHFQATGDYGGSHCAVH